MSQARPSKRRKTTPPSSGPSTRLRDKSPAAWSSDDEYYSDHANLPAQFGVRDDVVRSVLCNNCNAVDFNKLYQTDPRKVTRQGIVILDMGLIPYSASAADCQLCAMAARILSDNMLCSEAIKTESIRCHLRLFTCLATLGLARTKKRLLLSPSLVIAVIPGDSTEEVSILSRDASLGAGVILPVRQPRKDNKKSHQPLYVGDPHISRHSVNCAVMTKWLQVCSDNHPQCQYDNTISAEQKWLNERTRTSLLVIDCHTRTMADMPMLSSYVALSYVWGPDFGKDVLGHFEDGTPVPHAQPRTIEDAMKVVELMGLRYLWIDRYSINQHNALAKEEAIFRMAEIFEGAAVTLVSLASDVNAGLPGVSRMRERPLPRAVVEGMQLRSSGPTLEDILRRSKWSTRGWTLQEALLSKRMIIFAEEQLYWKCGILTRRESVQQSDPGNENRRDFAPAFDPDMFSEAKQYRKRFGEMRLPRFLRQITEYTRRNLSYDSDALNAFRALLGRANEENFYGIPIFLTQENQNEPYIASDTGLILGLLWSKSAHQWYKPWQEFGKGGLPSPESRKGFPSWSWASTRHCVQFDPISFDRELSKRHERLHACTYPHSPYNIAYATVQVPGRGSVVQAITDVMKTDARVQGMVRPVETILPSILQISSLIVQWKVISSEITYGFTAFRVALHLPPNDRFSDENSWLREGLLFLDNDADVNASEKSSIATGTALLLLNYRRHRYNWDDIVWWMAISPEGSSWQRKGLIRSFHEASEPVYRTRDSHTLVDREHRRPLLPANYNTRSYKSHPPDKSGIEEHYETIQLV